MAINVNRYTQYEPTTYQPRTLQELMLAPGYMRQQHDAMDENIATAETAIAQADFLGVHGDKVKGIQKGLYDNLNQQSESLLNEGFNPSAKGKFMRFNKEYQSAVGPQGDIGKAAAAKEAMKANKAAYIAGATQAGFPADMIAKNWADEEAKYEKEFAETGEITNIKERFSPNYRNATEELTKLLGSAGVTESDISSLTSNIIQDDPLNPGSYILTKGAQKAYGSNNTQLLAAVEFINNQINNPTSDIGRSLAEERKTSEEALNEVMGLSNVFKKTSTKSSTSSQISGYTPPKETKEDLLGTGITAASEQYAPVKYSGMSYSQIGERIAELTRGEGVLNKQQGYELNELESFQREITKELVKNPKYINTKTHIDELQRELNDIQSGRIINPKNMDGEEFKVYNTMTPQAQANYRQSKTLQLQNEIGEANKTINDISKGEIENKTMKMTTYTITPTTPKQAAILKTANDNFGKILRNNPQSLANLGDMQEVIIDGKPVTVSNQNDIDGISRLFYEADPGDIEWVSFAGEGLSGLPEYTLRLKGKKGGEKYDMDGLTWSKDNVGGSDNVQVRVAFNETSTGGAQNMNGLSQQYIMATGEQGVKVVQAMEVSKSYVNFSGQNWGDLDKHGVIDNNMGLQIIKAQKLSEMGAKSTSSLEEIKALERELNNKKVTKYE